MNKSFLILPYPQQSNDGYRRCTAMFFFQEPDNHTHAMWTAFRYYLTQHPLHQPSNLPLMDHVSCEPEWRVRIFKNHTFAAVLRGVDGEVPNRVECRVPDAKLVVVGGRPTDVLTLLEQGWVPQTEPAPKRATAICAMAGAA